MSGGTKPNSSLTNGPTGIDPNGRKTQETPRPFPPVR